MSSIKSNFEIEKIARNIDLDKITALGLTKLIRENFGLSLSQSISIARFIIAIFVTNKKGYQDEYLSLRECMVPNLGGINLESTNIRSLSNHFLNYSLLNNKSSLLMAANVLEGYRLGKIRGKIMK
jgi:hypothetical protein